MTDKAIEKLQSEASKFKYEEPQREILDPSYLEKYNEQKRNERKEEFKKRIQKYFFKFKEIIDGGADISESGSISEVYGINLGPEQMRFFEEIITELNKKAFEKIKEEKFYYQYYLSYEIYINNINTSGYDYRNVKLIIYKKYNFYYYLLSSKNIQEIFSFLFIILFIMSIILLTLIK